MPAVIRGFQEVSQKPYAEVLALVTVSRSSSGALEGITANLLGPVVINVRSGQGRQVVLAESPYSTREPVA